MTKRTEPWQVTDDVWQFVEKLWPEHFRNSSKSYQRAPGAGAKATCNREIFTAIAFVLRSGCSWRSLPSCYPPCKTVFGRFRKLVACGFFEDLHRAVVAEAGKLGVIDLSFVSIDSSTVRSLEGGELSSFHPKEKNKRGTKRHVSVDAKGFPLQITIGTAAEHDVLAAPDLIAQLPSEVGTLLADKAYDSAKITGQLAAAGITDGISKRRFKGREISDEKQGPRYVVEALFAHLNNFRRTRNRYDRCPMSFANFVCLAAFFVAFKKVLAILIT